MNFKITDSLFYKRKFLTNSFILNNLPKSVNNFNKKQKRFCSHDNYSR